MLLLEEGLNGVGRSKQQRCEVPSKENTAKVERMELWVLIHEDRQVKRSTGANRI